MLFKWDTGQSLLSENDTDRNVSQMLESGSSVILERLGGAVRGGDDGWVLAGDRLGAYYRHPM